MSSLAGYLWYTKLQSNQIKTAEHNTDSTYIDEITSGDSNTPCATGFTVNIDRFFSRASVDDELYSLVNVFLAGRAGEI